MGGWPAENIGQLYVLETSDEFEFTIEQICCVISRDIWLYFHHISMREMRGTSDDQGKVFGVL